MKKNKGYFSRPIRVVLFSIMMAWLLACVVIAIIMIVDATNQASQGQPYVADYNLSFALTFIFMSTGVYGAFYFITFIIYLKTKDKYEESNIMIKSNGVEDKETVRLRKTFDAEVIENNAPEVGAPLFSYTIIADEIEEKEYKDFIKFLMFKSSVVIVILLVILAGICGAMIPFGLILFLILIGLLLISAVLWILNCRVFIPNKMYKKAQKNPVPTLIRVYDNRIEEVTSLMSGSEIIYVCKFDNSVVKDTDKYLFIKSRNEKAIVGIMVSKSKLDEEKVNFILNKISTKAL